MKKFLRGLWNAFCVAFGLAFVNALYAFPGGAALMCLLELWGYHVGFWTSYQVVVFLGCVWFCVDAARRVAAANQ